MTIEDQFAVFWAAYPNKKGKVDALKAFKTAVKATTLENMLQAIKTYKECKPDWMAFKHPATWLRSGCWDDEWTVPGPVFQRRSNDMASFGRELMERYHDALPSGRH